MPVGVGIGPATYSRLMLSPGPFTRRLAENGARISDSPGGRQEIRVQRHDYIRVREIVVRIGRLSNACTEPARAMCGRRIPLVPFRARIEPLNVGS